MRLASFCPCFKSFYPNVAEADQITFHLRASEISMPYYAHSTSGRAEEEWEPLARHLAEVEDGARKRGQRFGAEPLAELAGRAT